MRNPPDLDPAVRDPVGNGLIASLARPGGNVTGVSGSAGLEMFAKQLELLEETVPKIRRVAILSNPANAYHQLAIREVNVATRSLGVQLQLLEARGPNEFDGAFAAMAKERVGALLVLSDAIFGSHQTRLVDLAARSRLPAAYGVREYVEAGGLMSYGPSLLDSYRRAANYVDKILKGAKPADLPVEQPTKFELLGGLSAPLTAEAQQAGKVYRIGLIAAGQPVSEMAGPEPVSPSWRALVQGLRALGYVEGQNLILERRSAEGRYERFSDIVAELVRLKADVIVTGSTQVAQTAKVVTTTVPIVMAASVDPVSVGLVQSLARPGGNITGLTTVVGPEIEAKRLELLRAMLPSVSRVAYLGSKENKDWARPWGQSVRTAAQALGVSLVLAEHTPRQYTDAFARISRARAEALFVSASPTAYADRGLIVDFATRTRLPSSFGWREAVELGGLTSYGVTLPDNFRRAAGFVDKILKGAKPADLPVEQPTKFELVINLKTAKALGLTIPQLLLLRADQVIE